MLTIFILFLLFIRIATDSFIFNGFSGTTGIKLDGTATVESNGLLLLTDSSVDVKGHAFYLWPLRFKNNTRASYSFSTNFIVALFHAYPVAHGIAFVVSPTMNFTSAMSAQYLGLLNSNNNGNPSNHLLAVELDTIQSPDLEDIDSNHVGIDVNSLVSNASHTAGYFTETSGFNELNLTSGEPIQVWIDYKGDEMLLTVTIAPANLPKPSRVLLSLPLDLSTVLLDEMSVGFSASNGAVNPRNGPRQYLLGWSFNTTGVSQSLHLSKLPRLPRIPHKSDPSMTLAILLPIIASLLVIFIVVCITLLIRHRTKYAEPVEEWEIDYGPHRFSYKDLFLSTKGFKKEHLLGSGSFGSVYRGVLPNSRMEVAVKKVSRESRQGMRAFIAEVESIGSMRHRNLVQLLGYCRRRGELLLVYDYMSNGSVDKFLHGETKLTLSWAQRFMIIKGVASGLLYLHEGWEKVVIHRDVKACNVLLDKDMNARLGDFGLARLYDHGNEYHTSHIMGTLGYLAPELSRTRKATTATDVFAFGAFMLEVACGRLPIESNEGGEEVVLVDWVIQNWRRGAIVESRDMRMGDDYLIDQMENVLRTGLHCLHPLIAARPSMRQVMQYLNQEAPVPELPLSISSSGVMALMLQHQGFDSFVPCSSTSGS